MMKLEAMWESMYRVSLGDSVAKDDSRAGQSIARGGHRGALEVGYPEVGCVQT